MNEMVVSVMKAMFSAAMGEGGKAKIDELSHSLPFLYTVSDNGGCAIGDEDNRNVLCR